MFVFQSDRREVTQIKNNTIFLRVYWLIVHVTPWFEFNWEDFLFFQVAPGCSIEGPAADYFDEKGTGYQYLSLRNQFGAGKKQFLFTSLIYL